MNPLETKRGPGGRSAKLPHNPAYCTLPGCVVCAKWTDAGAAEPWTAVKLLEMYQDDDGSFQGIAEAINAAIERERKANVQLLDMASTSEEECQQLRERERESKNKLNELLCAEKQQIREERDTIIEQLREQLAAAVELLQYAEPYTRTIQGGVKGMITGLTLSQAINHWLAKVKEGKQ